MTMFFMTSIAVYDKFTIFDYILNKFIHVIDKQPIALMRKSQMVSKRENTLSFWSEEVVFCLTQLYKLFTIFYKNLKQLIHKNQTSGKNMQIILLSRITILLLKGYFERVKINFHETNLKYRKIILLINFIFAPTFFLIPSCQILKNYAILINYKSLFQEKDSLQLKVVRSR